MLKWLTLAYLLLLACVVIGADLGLLGPFHAWVHRVPFGDKTCHFVFVGLLSLSISATLSVNLVRRRKRTVVLSTIFILVLLTCAEELSHSVLPTRHFSELDMLANVAGASLFGSLALLIPNRETSLEKLTLAAE